MSAKTIVAGLFLLPIVATTAQDAPTAMPPIQVEAVQHVADCRHRVLPTQREVGEWTGQHNLSQIYATRQRLMAEIGRACQRNDVLQVQLVSRRQAAAREPQLVAIAIRGH